MKQLFAIAAIGLLAFSVSAQTTTNITTKITCDVIVSGVSTNSSNATLSLVYGTKKDSLKIDGYSQAWNVYRSGGGALDFPGWLKQDAIDRAKAYQDAKQATDNATLLAKLASLLNTSPDLLSASDLTSLNTIAAKAP